MQNLARVCESETPCNGVENSRLGLCDAQLCAHKEAVKEAGQAEAVQDGRKPAVKVGSDHHLDRRVPARPVADGPPGLANSG